MSLYRATNLPADTTTTLGAGTSVATGIKVLGQFQIPDNQSLRLIEFGWSQDSATTTSPLLKVQTTDAASTLGTAFAAGTTIKPLYSNDSRASMLTMATTGTAYNNVSPTFTLVTRTSVRDLCTLYVPQVYVFQWPLGREPIVGNGTTENYLQILCNTPSTVNVIWWLVWDEL